MLLRDRETHGSKIYGLLALGAIREIQRGAYIWAALGFAVAIAFGVKAHKLWNEIKSRVRFPNPKRTLSFPLAFSAVRSSR